MAANHLSSPMGESSKMVPTLTENCLRGCCPAASPDPAGLDEGHGLTAACRAGHPVGPAQLDHEGERPVRIGEVADRVHEGRGYGWGVGYLVHAQRIAGSD